MVFKPVTSVMLVLYQLSYEATQLGPGHFVGLMCSCERTQKCKHHLSRSSITRTSNIYLFLIIESFHGN